jgi:uncharacterized protein (TIGR03437 family)
MANGQYQGTVSVVGGGSTLSIPVYLTVGSGAGALTVSPNPILFTSYAGSQSMVITDSSATSYTATSQPAWLLVNNTTYTAGAFSGSTSVTVSLNSSLLTSGQTYNGTILVATQPDNQQVTVQVSVNPSGTGTGTLQVTPSTLTLTSPANSSSPVGQSVSLTSNTSGLLYTAVPTITSGVGGWLQVTPASGSIPSNTTIYAYPSGLATGTYSGYVTFYATGAATATQVVYVTFNVGGTSTTGQVAPTSLAFAYQSGVPISPPVQTLVVTGTAGLSYSTSVTYTSANGTGWLSLSPTSGVLTSGGPAQITASINNLSLALGTYSAAISVNNGTATQVVSVTLSVTSSTVLMATPGSFVFTVQAGTGGGNPASQNLSLTTSSNTALAYTVIPSASWLSVTSTTPTTPAFFAVVVSASGLSSGLNSATLTISAAGASNSPLVVPVVVFVSGGVTVSPTGFNFSATPGSGTTAAQTLSLTATTATPFLATATTNSGGSWLLLNSTSSVTGTTPTTVTVTANASGLGAGTYVGNIQISAGGATQNVPVSFAVSSSGGGGGGGGTLTVTPSSLSFTVQSGGPPPGQQAVGVSTSSTTTVWTTLATTSGGGQWLSVSPSQGTGPTNVGVTVNPAGLAAGTYQGNIAFTPSGGTAQNVSVTLTVVGRAGLSISVSSLAFSYRTGDNPPASQTVSVTSTGGSLAFTTSASSSGWLAAAPASGSTPASVTVSVNPTGLSPSATPYAGTVTIAASGGSTQTVTVSLVVTGALPTLKAVVNAASYIGGAVSPGEIVTLFGDQIGPATQSTLTLDSNGKVSTTLGGVRVLFNGVPAPMIAVSASQVSAVVPYGMAGRVSTSVWVSYQGTTSNAMTVPVTTAAPGVFTLNASGSGPGAIVNQDGSINSPNSPASASSVVSLYVTGEGQTVPAGVDGSVTTPPTLPTPILPVAALIGGQPATILYAGGAPGLVAGVMQVNVRIQAGLSPGQQPVVVSVGGNSSQNGVTVSVQ